MTRQDLSQLHADRRPAALPPPQMPIVFGSLGSVRKFILFSVMTTDMPAASHRANSSAGTERSLKTRPSRGRSASSNTRNRMSGGSNNRPNLFSKELARGSTEFGIRYFNRFAMMASFLSMNFVSIAMGSSRTNLLGRGLSRK